MPLSYDSVGGGIYCTADEFARILFGEAPLTVSEEAYRAVGECYDFLEEFCSDKVIYGINTGFGPMAQYRIDDRDLKALQYNIIRSHSTGAGRPLEELYVRAAMIVRLRTFLCAKSGVHPQVIDLLHAMIERRIVPVVPEHGSVGASGDLVQLAHIALAMIGEGEVYYKGSLQNAGEVFRREGIRPLEMHIREGLAVTNGTAVMTGIGLVNLIYARRLVERMIVASVLMNEIAGSYDDFMAEQLNHLKLHYGQREVASRMRQAASGSGCMRKRGEELYKSRSDSVFEHKVQPYYSLRCVPQILGPVLDEVRQTEKVLTDELNSVDDNPVVDPDTRTVYHGGNFHGDYVSFAMDKLKIAVIKLTVLAERQINYLFHDRINGLLPPFVNMGVLGLNYGLQAAQFTATSTTAESQSLANSVYVHSIPNNNDNQDVVSMGTNSALMCKHALENAYQVVAVLMLALAQGVDCLEISDRLAASTGSLYRDIRAICPAFRDDRPKYREIERIVRYLKDNEL